MPCPESESLLEAGARRNLPDAADIAESRWQAAERQLNADLGLEERRRPGPVCELGLIVLDRLRIVRDRDVVPIEGDPSARRHLQVGRSGVSVVIHRPPADSLLWPAP